MRSAVTVSLVPQAQGGPFVFWNGLADAFRQAAALGFDAVEIFPPNAEAINVREVQQLCDAHRMKVAAIGTGGGWVIRKWSLTSIDGAVRAEARQFIRAIVEVAGALGAPAILGSMQGRVEGAIDRGQVLTWLAEALADLGSAAAAHGQSLLYEPLNRYETNLFNRAEDAFAFLEAHHIGHVQLLCDLFHMNLEEVSIPAALRAVAPRLGHVHFADSNRRAVGFGHTEMGPIVQTLRDLNYRGYLSAEVLPLPNSEAAAAQTMCAFRQFVP